MNQQEILRKIGGIIVELKEQHTYLQSNGSSFNDLELELFMANANFLTDHIEILKKIDVNAKSIPVSTVSEPEKATPAKPVIPDYFSEEEHLPFADNPLLKKLNTLTPTKETEPEPVESTKQEPAQEETNLSAQTSEEEPNPFTIADTSFKAQKSVPAENEEIKNVFTEAEVEPVETELETQQHQKVLEPKLFFAEEAQLEAAEPFQLPHRFINPEPIKPEAESVLTLNQQIAVQNGLTQPLVKAGFVGKSNQDLSALITLNDKLLFVKELFNGYNLAYAEAINILNRYTNFEQAEQFLKANYAEKNNWKDKPVTAARFLDLLKQRFA